MLAASNQRLYLLNKLKHAGLDEKGSADVLQAVSCMPLVVLRAWYTSTVTVGHLFVASLFRRRTGGTLTAY